MAFNLCSSTKCVFFKTLECKEFFFMVHPLKLLSIHVIYMCHFNVSLAKDLVLFIIFECNTNINRLDTFAAVLVCDQIWPPTFTLHIVSLNSTIDLIWWRLFIRLSPNQHNRNENISFFSNYLRPFLIVVHRKKQAVSS